MMEVSTICVNKKPDQETLTSVGKQISDIEIRYKPTERSGYYEILIRGETVSQYYVINGEKVPAVDNEGWYYTKDIGFIKDENLYLVGRKKNKMGMKECIRSQELQNLQSTTLRNKQALCRNCKIKV